MYRKIPIENPLAYEAVKGDLLELQFRVLNFPIIRDWHKKYIQAELAKDPHLSVKSIETAPGILIITAEIVDNPIPLMLIVGGVISILGGWFVWASLGRAYKLIKDPAVGTTINIGLIVAGAVIGLLLIRTVRG